MNLINESRLLAFFILIFQKFKNNYQSSSYLLRALRRLEAAIIRLFKASRIFGGLLGESFLPRYWKASLLYKLIDITLLVPSKLGRWLYLKLGKAAEGSFIIKLVDAILKHFHLLFSAFIVLLIIIPDRYWHNSYSLLMISALAFLFFLKTILDKNFRFDLTSLGFFVSAFILIIALGQIFSILPSQSLRFLVFYLVCFLSVLLLVNSIKTMYQFQMFIEILLFAVSLTGLYGIYQFIVGVPIDPALVDVTINEGMPGRIYSTFGNANDYAEILILILPFFAAVILSSKTFLKKMIFVSLAIPPFIALLLTYSRSGYLAFALTFFIFIVFVNWKLVPLFGLAGLILFPFLPQTVYNRILTIVNPNDTSTNARFLIYQSVFPMLKDYWVTGIGLGTDVFIKISRNYYQYQKNTPAHSHNLYLQIWFETGIFGITIFLGFVANLFKNCIRRISACRGKPIKYFILAGLAGLSGILLMGLVEYVWFNQRVLLIFWLVAGLSIIALKLSADGEKI